MSEEQAVKPLKLTAIVVVILVGLSAAFATWSPFEKYDGVTSPRCNALHGLVSKRLWAELLEAEKGEYAVGAKHRAYQPIPWTCIPIGRKEKMEGIYAYHYEGGVYFDERRPNVSPSYQKTYGGYLYPMGIHLFPPFGIDHPQSLFKTIEPEAEHFEMVKGRRLYIVFDGWVSDPNWRPVPGWVAGDQVVLVDHLVSARDFYDTSCSHDPACR